MSNKEFNDRKYHCTNHLNDSYVSLSNLCIDSKCPNRTDTQFCDPRRNQTDIYPFCDKQYQSIRSDVENFLCYRLNDAGKAEILHFSLDEKRNSLPNTTTILIPPHLSTFRTPRQYHQHCHRGLALHVWLD